MPQKLGLEYYPNLLQASTSGIQWEIQKKLNITDLPLHWKVEQKQKYQCIHSVLHEYEHPAWDRPQSSLPQQTKIKYQQNHPVIYDQYLAASKELIKEERRVFVRTLRGQDKGPEDKTKY